MYTSQDLGIAGNSTNPYPMANTKGYFSTNGGRTWTARGTVVTEGQLETDIGGFVQPSSNHLWAPAALQDVNNNTFLFVPDVANPNPPDPANPWGPNSHTSSRTAVMLPLVGAGAFGPFVSGGTLGDTSQPQSGAPGLHERPRAVPGQHRFVPAVGRRRRDDVRRHIHGQSLTRHRVREQSPAAPDRRLAELGDVRSPVPVHGAAARPPAGT
jgi:hypothetical protein